RGIAAQGDEIGHLPGLDAVALAHLRRADARHLSGAHRLQDGRALRGELKGIAVAAGDDNTPAALFFSGGSGTEKIVGLVARRLGESEAAGEDEARQDLQLLYQLGVEVAVALVVRQRLLPPRRRLQRVPGGEDGARSLVGIEPQQEIREADDGAAALVVTP